MTMVIKLLQDVKVEDVPYKAGEVIKMPPKYGIYIVRSGKGKIVSDDGGSIPHPTSNEPVAEAILDRLEEKPEKKSFFKKLFGK